MTRADYPLAPDAAVPAAVPAASLSDARYRGSVGVSSPESPMTLWRHEITHVRTPPTGGLDTRASVVGRLSDRDIGILVSLRHLRLLNGRQIQRLHCVEGSSLTQARRCRRTLERLYSLGLLHRFERRVGGMRAGSSGFLYALSARGQRLLAGAGSQSGARRRRPWEPSALFVNHVLAVSELCVEVVEAERRGELEVMEFEAEPHCWRDYVGLGGERLVLKPDAFAVVGVGDEEQHSLIEVDRTTEGLNTIRRKADAFRVYALSGFEQQRRGVFPKVVFLTTDEQRAGRIRDVVHRLPDGDELFAVGIFDEALKLLRGDAA